MTKKLTAAALISEGRHHEAYDAMVADGVAPALAEMLALQSVPAVRTETSYMANYNEANARKYEKHPEIREMLVAETRKHDPNFSPAGKVYVDQLVRPGTRGADPEAWADRGEVRSHIKKVCEKRGWGAEGTVNVKAAERPDTSYSVAEDLVQKRAAALMQNDRKLKKGEAVEFARVQSKPKDIR